MTEHRLWYSHWYSHWYSDGASANWEAGNDNEYVITAAYIAPGREVAYDLFILEELRWNP